MSSRQVIFSADDFGLSPGVNAGISKAHSDGLLTDVSLMVNGVAFEEAVEIARAQPSLSVGLHLVLVQGRATRPAAEIPGLVDASGTFSNNPVTAGARYFFSSALMPQIESEVRAQLEKFLSTGLRLSHVDGHLNIHMQPKVLALLLRLSREYGIRAMRLPREPLHVSLQLDGRERWRKTAESIVFRALDHWAAPRIDAAGIRYPNRTFGLHNSGHMTESHILSLIERLPVGVTEIYSHASIVDAEAQRWRPAHYESQAELDALVSSRVRQALQRGNITQTTFRELSDQNPS